MIKSILLAGLLLLAAPASALEVIIFHAEWCHFCQKFDTDFDGVDGYNETEQGKKVPMTLVDISTPPKANWNGREDIRAAYKAGKFKVTGTPTFIFWDNGTFINELVGYRSKEHFLMYVDSIIDRERQKAER